VRKAQDQGRRFFEGPHPCHNGKRREGKHYLPVPNFGLKYEEVYIKGYQIPADAQAGLGAYFPFYNDRRYHQALAYKTPHEVHYGSHETD